MAGLTVIYNDIVRIWVSENNYTYNSGEDYELDFASEGIDRYVAEMDVSYIGSKVLSTWLD